MRTLVAGVVVALCTSTSVRAADDPVLGARLQRGIARAFAQSTQHGPTDEELQRIHAAQVEADRNDREQLNLATAVYLGVAGADWSLTAVCFKVGCNDHSGYSAGYFIGGDGFTNSGTAAALGLGLDALIVLGAREWVAPDHPKLARGILWVASGVRVVIVTQKISDLREHAVRAK